MDKKPLSVEDIPEPKVGEELPSKNVTVKVEVDEDRNVWMIFDRKTEAVFIPYQDAFAIGDVLDSAIQDARRDNDVIDHVELIQEQMQVRLTGHQGLVVIFTDWTDRIKFSWRSAMMVRDAIRITAQNVQLAERRGIRFAKTKTDKSKGPFPDPLGIAGTLKPLN